MQFRARLQFLSTLWLPDRNLLMAGDRTVFFPAQGRSLIEPNYFWLLHSLYFLVDRGYVEAEAEIGAMPPQAKGCLGLLEAERGRNGASSRSG